MTHMHRWITGLVVLLLANPMPAAADAVLDWNAIMLTTVGGQNPFAQARFSAITHLAMFEAVNAITGDYEPYLGMVAAPPGASADAAAIAAAHRVLTNYFPASQLALDDARAASLSRAAASRVRMLEVVPRRTPCSWREGRGVEARRANSLA
jgi:hypothetical protein